MLCRWCSVSFEEHQRENMLSSAIGLTLSEEPFSVIKTLKSADGHVIKRILDYIALLLNKALLKSNLLRFLIT